MSLRFLFQYYDRNILYFLYHLSEKNFLKEIFSFLAFYLIYSLPLCLIILWFLNKKRVALLTTISGLFAWKVLSPLLGLIYFRPRPFVTHTESVKELVFHRPDRSFPSDHAACLFAVALCFWLFGEKKLSSLFFVLTLLVGITRVSTGLHYPSDILAGFLVGLISAFLIKKTEKWLTFYIVNPLINLAKKLRLG